MLREKLNPQKKILGYQPKIKLMDVWAMYFARYLGLGMRYGGGTCTIVISMNGVFKSTFKTSFERFFHADCNGPIPSFISHSHTKIWCVFHLTLEAKCFELHTYSTYVGIGMLQSWTIAICMNGTFKRCPFVILSPNTNKGITYGFDSVRYWQITMHQKKWTKEI